MIQHQHETSHLRKSNNAAVPFSITPLTGEQAPQPQPRIQPLKTNSLVKPSINRLL